MVGHGRVDEDERAVLPVTIEKAAYKLELLEGTKVARVDGIEVDPVVNPALGDGLDLVGQVIESEALESGVNREHGSGKNATLDSHGRDDGQRNGEGTLSNARDVLNAYDALHAVPLSKKATGTMRHPLADVWSGRWESNPPHELGRLRFYR